MLIVLIYNPQLDAPSEQKRAGTEPYTVDMMMTTFLAPLLRLDISGTIYEVNFKPQKSFQMHYYLILNCLNK